MTLEEIKQIALQIRGATTTYENTAYRVGTLLTEMAQKEQELIAAIDTLRKNLAEETSSLRTVIDTKVGHVEVENYGNVQEQLNKGRAYTDEVAARVTSESSSRQAADADIRETLTAKLIEVGSKIGNVEVENYGTLQNQLNVHRERIDHAGLAITTEVSDRLKAVADLGLRIDATARALRELPLATPTTDGLMSAADKAKISNAYTAHIVNNLTSSNSSSRFSSYPHLVQYIASLPISPKGNMSLAVGQSTSAHGFYNVAIGWGAVAGDENRPSDANCSASLACGYSVRVSAGCAAGFGKNNRGSGFCSFVAGEGNSASGPWSVSLGKETQATANTAFAAGWQCVASGPQSFVIGSQCRAEAENSVAAGKGNVARNTNNFVVGQYAAFHNALFAVGCGQSDATRKTALYVDRSGEVHFYHTALSRYVRLSELQIAPL